MRIAAIFPFVVTCLAATQPTLPSPKEIDGRVHQLMAATQAKGIAIAVVDDGQVRYVQAYGVRNARGEPLQTDTVMYGASLTKAVVAYATLLLADAGKLTLDTPLADLLAHPLAYSQDPGHRGKYGPYNDLAADERWRKITPRVVLTHSTGFANFWFMEPDQKLRLHFDPGARYAYSGEGFSLLQFAVEQGRKERGLGLDFDEFTQTRIFDPLGMTRTRLMWRDDFAGNLADGWNDQGKVGEHDARSKVRAAGSMDTTIADLAKFVAALVRGAGLSAASRAEMTRPQLPITTKTQFPSLQPELPPNERPRNLAAGLGVIVFDGPQGRGFFKGGHNEMTANTMVCLESGRRAVLILSNDVRAEAGFAELVRFILGETGVPFEWEYGDQAGKS